MISINTLRGFFIGKLPGLADWFEDLRFLRHLKTWRREGVNAPPTIFKRARLLAEAKRIKADNFVETGTFRGDTTWFMRRGAKRLYTIEFDPKLAEQAQQRFAGLPQVKVIRGDSAEVLKQLMPEINGRILFWLDGHATPGVGSDAGRVCPLLDELATIFKYNRGIISIFIDDARLFGTDPGYPTVDVVRKVCEAARPDFRFQVENDMLLFTGNE